MRKSIMRLFIEAIGWILTAIGAYYVFGKGETLGIHYFVLIVGIVLIIVNFPYKDFRRKK